MSDNSQNTLIAQEQTQPLLSMDSNENGMEDKCPWYAVRIFCSKQKEIADFIQSKGLECFIPMEYTDVLNGEQRLRHVLRPVVRNLLFLKKNMEESDIRKLLSEMPYKISVIRKDREHQDFYEIPYKQMFDFRVMCNPEIAMRKFLTEENAKLKSGTPVAVKFGPLKGLTGKLVRQSKKYFLLKEVPGMAVMIKVSRWCCKALE
jgi:hypothetical protein